MRVMNVPISRKDREYQGFMMVDLLTERGIRKRFEEK